MIKVEIFHNSILKSCSYCVYDNLSLEGYIIDVGDVDPIILFVTESNIRIKGVFLTHPHFDHVYGITSFAKEYPSTFFYCSAKTLEGLKDEDVNMSYMYLEDEFELPQDNRFVIIDNQSVVECFDKPIHIISCPGHDSGCLSFIIEDNIFTGDSYTPFAPVTYNWHRCNKEFALKSEASLLELIESRDLYVYPGHYQEIYSYCPDITLYDFYGPTEATIYCTYYKLERDRENKEQNGIISIGQPLKNCIGLIMDEKGNVLPANEKGELCIAGDQVTQGYWKNDEKNASSFFIKEIDGQDTRFYHTGDLCYKDEDGDIMYSGRLDNQVKIQGFRIEPGEIEHHAREASGRNAVCVAKEVDGNNILYLAFEGDEFDTKQVVDYMKSKMPSYMIPSHIVFIKTFPLNSNDKIDRPTIKKNYCNL